MNIPRLISTSNKDVTASKTGVNRLMPVVSFLAGMVITARLVFSTLFSNTIVPQPARVHPVPTPAVLQDGKTGYA